MSGQWLDETKSEQFMGCPGLPGSMGWRHSISNTSAALQLDLSQNECRSIYFPAILIRCILPTAPAQGQFRKTIFQSAACPEAEFQWGCEQGQALFIASPW
jgi:hypothetical protein